MSQARILCRAGINLPKLTLWHFDLISNPAASFIVAKFLMDNDLGVE